MRILYILGMPFDPEEGGVQRTTYKLSSQFAKEGVENAVLSPGWVDSNYTSHLQLFNLNVDGASAYDESIRFTMQEFKPDVVINQMPHDLNITKSLGRLRGEFQGLFIGCLRNSLFSVKNNLETYARLALRLPVALAKWRVFQWLGLKIHFFKHRLVLKKILDYHDRFILLTQANVDELRYFIGNYKTEKVGVIPNSIPKINPTDNKDKRLLYVGRLASEQKRAEQLIPLWREIHKNMPDWEFDIVGDGPLHKAMKEEIEKFKLPRINLLGKQDPSSYYSRSKIFVMTSAFEGFPNVLIEGMSFGSVPVCYKSYGAISEIMVNNEEGILVADRELFQLGKAIEILSKDDERIRAYSINALAKSENFTIEKVIKIWLEEFAFNGIKSNPV